jgi:hypothetical protein
MTFTIRQNATLPILKMKLIKDSRYEYKKFYEMLENATVTFSMKDTITGVLKIANKAGTIQLQDQCYSNTLVETDNKDYLICYQFDENETNKPGVYHGLFEIKFLDNDNTVTGTLIAPIGEELEIHIIESFTKSEIIYI